MKKYYILSLPHGGKLYYVKNKISKTTKVDLAFDCGSRCDTIPGLAHFTEHMFFTGTDEMPKKQQVADKYFSFIGANAYTNAYKIAFSANIFSNELEDYLKTVANLITHSTFSNQSVKEEIKVVQQEIANYKDDNKEILSYIDEYNMYREPVFKNTLLGSEKSVATIKSKDVKEFVAKYFVANNLDAFIVSPLPLREVKRMVERELSNKLPIDNDFKRLEYNFIDIKDDNFFSITKKKLGKAYLIIHFSLNKNMYDRDYLRKLSLVIDMINDYSHGMNKKLRLDKNLVYYSNMNYSSFKNSANVTFITECENKNVNEVISSLSEYIKDTLKNGFTQAELDKVKRYFDYNDKNSEPRTSKLQNGLLFYKKFGFIEKYRLIKELALSTTLDECNTIFKEIFTSPKVSLTLMSDLDKKSVMNKKEFNELFNNSSLSE